MKRKSRFLVVALSAVITFGTLVVTIGKPFYLKHFQHCHQTEMKQQQEKEKQ